MAFRAEVTPFITRYIAFGNLSKRWQDFFIFPHLEVNIIGQRVLS